MCCPRYFVASDLTRRRAALSLPVLSSVQAAQSTGIAPCKGKPNWSVRHRELHDSCRFRPVRPRLGGGPADIPRRHIVRRKEVLVASQRPASDGYEGRQLVFFEVAHDRAPADPKQL